MINFTFLLFFVILIGWNIKHSQNNSETLCSLNNTLALKGVLAIAILFGHVGLIYNRTEFTFVIFEKLAISFVGMFFFFSGYGLLYSLKTKENYLHDYYKRIISFIIPVILNLLCIVIFSKITHYPLAASEYINWYLYEQLFFYIIFYFVFKKAKNYEKGVLYISIITLLLIVTLYLFNFNKSWIMSTLCFPFGLFCAAYNDKIKPIITDKWYYSLLFLPLLLFVFYFAGKTKWGMYICFSNLFNIMFVIAILIFCQHFQLGNKLSYFLGRYSYAIYLYHVALMKPLYYIRPELDVSKYLFITTNIDNNFFSYNYN